jgi:hypothetical protein
LANSKHSFSLSDRTWTFFNEDSSQRASKKDWTAIETDDDDPDLVPPFQAPTHTACRHTNGVYHVSIADIEGGVGTALLPKH